MGGVRVPVLGGVPAYKVCQLAGRVGSLEGSHVCLEQPSTLQPGPCHLFGFRVICSTIQDMLADFSMQPWYTKVISLVWLAEIESFLLYRLSSFTGAMSLTIQQMMELMLE